MSPQQHAKPSNNTHDLVELAPNVWIDEGIAPLIAALWDQGYHTEWSCQGGGENNRRAYVSFTSFDDGVRFMRHVHEVIGVRNFYVHSALYTLEIGDRYNENDEIDPSLGPIGCVRFYPEIEGFDIIAITTEAFTKAQP